MPPVSDISDDDIEIVEKDSAGGSNSETDDICQLCSAPLRGLDQDGRKEHYSEHGSGQSTGTHLKHGKLKRSAVVGGSRRKTSPMKSGENTSNGSQEDVFWCPTQAEAPPHNYTPGVLSVLKEALKQSHRQGSTLRAVLCYEQTPHILHESFDRAWGCGYRNFLMACAALMGQQTQAIYFPYLDSPLPPSVRNLQRWIEDAWKNGYDETGASELDHKLIGTKKKIGTGDLYVAFTSRKIPCTLVDFDLRKSPKGFDKLTDWVVNYFTEKYEGDVNKILCNASPVTVTLKMPVIMQSDGHSVTIVGYELAKNDKVNLLVLDPSRPIPKDIRQTALAMQTSGGWGSPSTFFLPGKGKRGERLKSPAPRKRPRTDEDPDGAVSIPDSDSEKADDPRQAVALESTLAPDKVIKAFRPRHKKKQEYQLLYFTMGDPLSDLEQTDCKVVYAEY